MQFISPITKIDLPIFNQHNLNVYVKRDDLIHPIISGNKWRKLKHNLLFAKEAGFKGVLSFGGAYSNHLHALAYAGFQEGLATKAIIRGEPEYINNSTLSQASHWGLACCFVDRKTYKRRFDEDYLTQLQQAHANYYLVPEGGSNTKALVGVGEVIDELSQQVEFDTLITPVGSGGTMAGLINADKNNHNLIGIAVLKNAGYLQDEINKLLPASAQQYNNWQLLTDHHLGGYAKFSAQHASKLHAINQATKLLFEPVYSGKMMLALLNLVEQGYFPSGARIVLLHTGGLQGINGLLEQGRLSTNQWHWQSVQPAH